MRPELEPLPVYMRGLPVDERGYPIPYFVAYMDGKPEFRAMDPEKLKESLKRKLCWVCGYKLGVNMAFVAGPMCGVNRTSSEPPSHYSCALWSAHNCPFLTKPQMVRREDELINNASTRENAAGMAITRNPGVAMIWVTRQYEVFLDPEGRPLIQMGEPERIEWYAEGRVATRAEVEKSIETGLPNLEAVARTEPGGLEALHRSVGRFEKWLPHA